MCATETRSKHTAPIINTNIRVGRPEQNGVNATVTVLQILQVPLNCPGAIEQVPHRAEHPPDHEPPWEDRRGRSVSVFGLRQRSFGNKTWGSIRRGLKVQREE